MVCSTINETGQTLQNLLLINRLERYTYLILRNHGDSPKMTSMTHDANVNDLDMFLKNINEPVILIGHSLGGTAAMEIAFKKPHLVKQLALIDISPLGYPANEETEVSYLINQIRTVLNIINSTEEFCELNSVLEKYFQKYIKNVTLCKMILSNVKKENDKFILNINLNSIEVDLCQKKKMKEVYPLRGSYQGKTLLIHGNSDYNF
ncbi:sn-1-specific diacylglycerol lipase ABHD11-like isoform X2 [Centruroides vittatus]|uniref:sn-1-specific diacylglycerol lipase ABHD11-like isoform X2 n=1 Tax=Centruroides vittatus TaxID=120091 RepID=UPI00350F3E01